MCEKCFSKLLSQGHQYDLTVIDMLINYTWFILQFTKEVDEVVHVYLFNVYSKFDGSHKIFVWQWYWIQK